MEYAIHDALLAGFQRIVFVVRESTEAEFREHLKPLLSAGIELRFVHQSLADLPRGVHVSGERKRPWGTGHALWSARAELNGPFAVCNADDFYGRDAYRVLADALRNSAAPYLVGYRLDRTLSSNGGVSRGLVAADSQEWVTGVDELLDLEAIGGLVPPSDGVSGRDGLGARVQVQGDVSVSMNLWGFPASLLPGLGDLFGEFLRQGPGEEQEFYLSQALGDLVQCGRAQCRLLKTHGSWLGVTFPGDGERVRSSLASLASQGEYPADLSTAWKSLL